MRDILANIYRSATRENDTEFDRFIEMLESVLRKAKLITKPEITLINQVLHAKNLPYLIDAFWKGILDDIDHVGRIAPLLEILRRKDAELPKLKASFLVLTNKVVSKGGYKVHVNEKDYTITSGSAPSLASQTACRIVKIIGDPLGLNWRKTGATLGLRWKRLGQKRPGGTELINVLLTQSMQSDVEFTMFTQEEWNKFGIEDLTYDHYIKSGADYYGPASIRPNLGKPLNNEALEKSLTQKQEFTLQELKSFKVNVERNHYVETITKGKNGMTTTYIYEPVGGGLGPFNNFIKFWFGESVVEGDTCNIVGRMKQSQIEDVAIPPDPSKLTEGDKVDVHLASLRAMGFNVLSDILRKRLSPFRPGRFPTTPEHYKALKAAYLPGYDEVVLPECMNELVNKHKHPSDNSLYVNSVTKPFEKTGDDSYVTTTPLYWAYVVAYTVKGLKVEQISVEQGAEFWPLKLCNGGLFKNKECEIDYNKRCMWAMSIVNKYHAQGADLIGLVKLILMILDLLFEPAGNRFLEKVRRIALDHAKSLVDDVLGAVFLGSHTVEPVKDILKALHSSLKDEDGPYNDGFNKLPIPELVKVALPFVEFFLDEPTIAEEYTDPGEKMSAEKKKSIRGKIDATRTRLGNKLLSSTTSMLRRKRKKSP
ncbi:MAG: hypothetical protein CBC65_000475 [Rhodothermaceae bacterium TMED105]|nr:MAG: hypothetical protein CBC65_000475 [Rhodothermaceae bacterium TMED105]|tara:strand:- start:100 stop:2052 length:1953 start_codon:yes stop_codon:yes gene_type:complete